MNTKSTESIKTLSMELSRKTLNKHKDCVATILWVPTDEHSINGSEQVEFNDGATPQERKFINKILTSDLFVRVGKERDSIYIEELVTTHPQTMGHYLATASYFNGMNALSNTRMHFHLSFSEAYIDAMSQGYFDTPTESDKNTADGE